MCHQLAQHNKELAALLKPSETADPRTNQALEYYANHTAQIEVFVFSLSEPPTEPKENLFVAIRNKKKQRRTEQPVPPPPPVGLPC